MHSRENILRFLSRCIVFWSYLRYLVVTLLWTVVFFFGAAAVVGLGSSAVFASRAAGGDNPAADTWLISWVSQSWILVPLAATALALLLCAFSRLPGTKLAEPRARTRA